MKLLLSQKNHLFDLIERSGLTPGLFEYKEYSKASDSYETKINLKNSPFFYSICQTSRSLHVNVSPSGTRYEEIFYSAGWDDIEAQFRIWLYNLRREIQLEDKWEKLNSEIQSLQLYNDGDDFLNSKFTVPEYLEIKQKIFKLKEGVSKLELLPAQIALLNDKLDLVLDLTTQLGRFDWKNFFIGTIMGIIMQLEVTQDNAKAIWALIKQVFHNYFIGQ